MRLLLFSLAAAACMPLVAQSGPLTVAPGLTITQGATPWALDHYKGQAELVPIHHSDIDVNHHKGANVAGSLAGSVFYKPKMTTEVAGEQARTVIHDTKPVFYVLMPNGGDESPDDQAHGLKMKYTLVHAKVVKGARIMSTVKFTQLTGGAQRSDGQIDTHMETVKSGWMKLEPTVALEEGEYAIVPVPADPKTFSTSVFDFRIDTHGENAKDAIRASSSE